MRIEVVTDRRRWDTLVDGLAFGHPLQLWVWGEVKRLNGWTPHRLMGLHGDTPIAAGQILFWRIPFWGRSVAYLPRGPVGALEHAQEFLRAAGSYAKAHGALYLRVEPNWVRVDMPTGWRPGPDGILLSQTYTIDLTAGEDVVLAAMRGKTRQYIRKAETNGVVVERDTTGARLDDVWRIYQETAARAAFGLHPFVYYQRLFALYGERNGLYCALVDGKVEAFLWLVEGGGVAFELYGGVTALGGALRANYLLKWHAIVDMKRVGCATYDFNGRLNEGVDQ